MIDRTFFIDDNELGKCIVLKEKFDVSLVDYMIQNKIYHLRLSESIGWKEEDILFLSTMPFLRGIEIYSSKINDIRVVESLLNLEYIGVDCDFNSGIDFSMLTNLKICKFRWRPKIKGISELNSIEILNIVNYPHQDIELIKNLINLKSLHLTSKTLISLKGIENLSKLEILDLYNCTKLESLVNISSLESLRTVELRKCKNIYDISPLGELRNIEEVLLEDCGKIKSLKPLRKCFELRRIDILGNTIIEDGELAELINLPKLKQIWFMNRKHYTHSLEDFTNSIQSK